MPNWTNEQREAIEKSGKNIIVSAGAGSGKTTVLSERVVQKVKKGTSIDSLLILTFTNAASHEMKERIRENLIDNNLLSQASKVDSAYITTFDSYALSIVKKYHYLLNINKDISVCENSLMEIKKIEILDQVFLEMYDDLKFQNFINDFCDKDDDNIKDAILSLYDKLDLMYDKKTYLDTYIDRYYDESFINNNIDKYLYLIKNKVDKFNNLVNELSLYVKTDYINKYDEIINNLNKDYDNMIFLDIPRLPNNMGDDAKKIKGNIDKLYKETKEMHSYNNLLEIKNSILETKKYIEVIIDILKQFDLKINNYKKEFDLYEFSDIAKLAITLVKENKIVRDELNYEEILIDEYQDTNDLQDTFISYIENNNIYMVGDIKQSIYRFRNANPKLFKDKYEKYSLGEEGIKIDLNKNFRSRDEVVNNINTMFNLIMDKHMGGADYINSHQMIFGNEDYLTKGKKDIDSNMELLLYENNGEYKNVEIEIFTIISSIKEKMKYEKILDKKTKELRNIKYSDFTILMDRGSNFDLYKKVFEYSGIPLTIWMDEKLTDSVEFSLIKNIICFMITKDEIQKKHSFMSILRSYLFNLDDNTIFNYIISNDYSYLDYYITNIEDMTPSELMIYIIDKFEFYENIINIGDIKKREQVLSYLLTLSEKLTELGYDIELYYNYLEKIIENDIEIKYEKNEPDSDSVKIMNIHKSKGLEFPICYFSGLTSKFNIKELNSKILYDNDLGIVIPIFDNGERETIYKKLLKDNYYKEEISEKIRLFYVALTRTKEKIIMILPDKDIYNQQLDYDTKLSYRSLGDMIYSVYDVINEYKSYIDLDNIGLIHDYNLIKKTNYEKDIELTNEKINKIEINIDRELIDEERYSKINNKIYSIEEYTDILFGKHMHSVLENFDFLNPNYDSLNSLEKEKIKKFMNHNLFNNIKNIYKEYEFIYEDNNTLSHGIIDLLLEYDNEFKIIDYKLKNIEDEAYVKQLNGYKNYIMNITGKSVRTYLYSIIDDNLKEIKGN